MSGSRMAFMKEYRQAVANNIVSGDGCLEKPLLNQSRQVWPERESSLTEQPAELLMRIVHFSAPMHPDGGQYAQFNKVLTFVAASYISICSIG
jgi:hypothetical protein